MNRIILVTVLLLSIPFTNELSAQKSKLKRESVTHPEAVPVPVPDDSTHEFHMRPKLSMQEALKLAEKFIVSEHIDIAPYFLFEVHLIQYGSQNEERWYFWWINDNGSMGDYVELTVTMNGGVDRLASM